MQMGQLGTLSTRGRQGVNNGLNLVKVDKERPPNPKQVVSFFKDLDIYLSFKKTKKQLQEQEHKCICLTLVLVSHYCLTYLFSILCSDVKFFDAGDYLCNATNKFGWQSASGSLVVKEHTRITGRPQDYEVEAGKMFT